MTYATVVKIATLLSAWATTRVGVILLFATVKSFGQRPLANQTDGTREERFGGGVDAEEFVVRPS
jgi:hypothetical protein